MSVMTGPIIEEGPKIEYVDGPWRFSGVAWKDYEAMLRIVAGTNVRVTYDDGEMEVVSPHHRHERTKTSLGWRDFPHARASGPGGWLHAGLSRQTCAARTNEAG